MDDIDDDDDGLFDDSFEDPADTNDLFLPFDHPPDVREWMIIGPINDEDGWDRRERKHIEDDDITI
jgi:hypothetical protein